MAVPSYEDILARLNVDNYLMKLTVSDDHILDLASKLESSTCELLAKRLGLPKPDIEDTKGERNAQLQRVNILDRWKERNGSMATYEVLTKALLRIERTHLAEEVVALALSLTETLQPTNELQPPSLQSSLVMPPSPANSSLDMSPLLVAASGIQASHTNQAPVSSSGLEDLYQQGAAMTLASSKDRAQDLMPILTELEEGFYELVKFVESTLEKCEKIGINNIKGRFRMLPQSVRRRLETDINYSTVRQKILESGTIKELFDNLTSLRHWSFMMPDTLIHIVKDIKIDDIHQKIDKYKEKLSTFKTNTKLRDLIGTSFPVPDYCIELKMEVEGWEDKTIEQAEKSVVNIMPRATYGQNVPLGWKGVNTGSLKLTFILLESIKIRTDNKLEAYGKSGVVSVELDGDVLYREEGTKQKDRASQLPSRLWYETGTTDYVVGGKRDVLIIASDPPYNNPEAVARRPGQLTEEDRQTLQRQGVFTQGQDDLAIVKARHQLDKRLRIVEVKSGKLSRNKVMESIGQLFTTTNNEGVGIYYIGAGHRNTGDWCFEDGFITFNDITQLYLRARANMKGRVLSIASDCSYSGCWVRDCMEFLDEQGVEPCGHKAREKGMVIQVGTSCQSYQIPTELCYSMRGTFNDKNTGEMRFEGGQQLLATQRTDYINCSQLHCHGKTIDEPCTLQPHHTWKQYWAGKRIRIVRRNDQGHPAWWYLLLEDDTDIQKNFDKCRAEGRIGELSKYGKILASGYGDRPPNYVTDKINEEYLTSFQF